MSHRRRHYAMELPVFSSSGSSSSSASSRNQHRAISPALSPRLSPHSGRDVPERRFTAPASLQEIPSGPEWHTAPSTRDLTGQVTQADQYYFDMGRFADIYRAKWRQGGKERLVCILYIICSMYVDLLCKVAVKIFRSDWGDRKTVEEIREVIHSFKLVEYSHETLCRGLSKRFQSGSPLDIRILCHS